MNAKIFKKSACLALFLLQATCSFANDVAADGAGRDEIVIRLGGWSTHLSDDGWCKELKSYCEMSEWREFNGNNKAIGVRYGAIELSTMANSFDERSVVAAYHYDYSITDWLDIGAALGVATGYEIKTGWKLSPFVQPKVTAWMYDTVGIELGWLPTKSQALTLSTLIKF